MLSKSTVRLVMALGLLALLGVLAACSQSLDPEVDAAARNNIEEEVSESLSSAYQVQTSKGTSVSETGEQVRAGSAAFKHTVPNSGERAEINLRKVGIGDTRWYGWSMFVPADYSPDGVGLIVHQHTLYPPKEGRNLRPICGAAGHHLTIGGDGSLSYALQHQGGSDTECEKFKIFDNLDQYKGKWIDFVMHAKWTGNSDGFFRLWVREANGAWSAPTVDYKGATWWNDEGAGPNFKMGAYTGDPGRSGSKTRIIYTDEYRRGSAQASFEDVAPGGGPSQPNPDPEPQPEPEPEPQPEPGAFPQEGVWYSLKNAAQGQFLDTSGGGLLSLKPDSNGDDRLFQFVPAGNNSFFIVNKRSGRGALDTRPEGDVRWMSDASPAGDDKRWTVSREGESYRLENVDPARGFLTAQAGQIVWSSQADDSSLWTPAAAGSDPAEPSPEPDPEPTPRPSEPDPDGELLKVMDAETADFSQWRNPDGGGSGNHEIVQNPVAQGRHAFKWTHKDGRTESASDYFPAAQETWIGWKLWVPEDFNDSFSGGNSQGLSVSQIHGHNNGCDPSILMLRVADGQFFWWLKNTGDLAGVYDNLGSVPKEQWIDLLVNYKLTNSGDGYFRFWIDGELKLELEGSSWPCNTGGAYFKMGTYAFGYDSGDYILGDAIRVGTSRAAVED